MAERQVTHAHFVPSMLAAFLEAPDLVGFGSVRRVLASGEALPVELVERFERRAPGVPLVNLYGPTEAAVEVTWWSCRPGDGRSSIPIGHPVANTRLHVVDSRLRPTPLGVPGELLLAGVQVGAGYHQRPALTAEKFLPDGFGQGVATPGARVYRTGDLVRFRTGGEVEYLGRIDFQVKVRGFRIELGEIEAALLAEPGVQAAVVVARRAPDGDARLIGYVVGIEDEAEAEAGGALRRLAAGLAERLPAHMVPPVLVPLAALPLTPSGKTDRQALPEPWSGPTSRPRPRSRRPWRRSGRRCWESSGSVCAITSSTSAATR
jgi:acyl-CoA synthetase (AMP-forming)/AMP-acid ligase II